MPEYFSDEQAKIRENKIIELLGKKILESELMTRLHNVSFLGTLNLEIGSPIFFSRYEHCISVAYLTWIYCKNLNLPSDTKLVVILLALIHDVGHPPFSHSTMVYLQRRAHYKKTERSALTEGKIKRVLQPGYESFPNELKKYSLDELSNLIYRISYSKKELNSFCPIITELFDTPFCPDTFDGINRAWFAINKPIALYRLQKHKVLPLTPMDPETLVNFVSSTGNPLQFSSRYTISSDNLIYQFHKLTRVLYNEIIYSSWQTSAMVMFSVAIDIAYKGISHFPFSNIDDNRLLKRINKNVESKTLYDQIFNEKYFDSLSLSEPELYKLAKESYNISESSRSAKEIERIIAEKLFLKPEYVYCYVFYPLVWDYKNIHIEEIGDNLQNPKEKTYKIKYDRSEGEYSKNFQFEVFYRRSF